jgi:hypothetical protein
MTNIFNVIKAALSRMQKIMVLNVHNRLKIVKLSRIINLYNQEIRYLKESRFKLKLRIK